MTEALLELLPESPVYHVGMYRNPGSNIPVQYYNRLPKGNPSDVALILDPVIASCQSFSQSVIQSVSQSFVVSVPSFSIASCRSKEDEIITPLLYQYYISISVDMIPL